MNTSVVGLLVNLKDNFSKGFENISKKFSRATKGLTNDIGAFKVAFSQAWKDSGMNTALIETSASFYAISKYVQATTAAFNQQYMALQNLDSLSNRWGQNYATRLATVNGLVKEGAMSTVEAARTVASGLQGMFTDTRTQALVRGIRDLAAFRRPAGQSLGQTVSSVMAGLSQGNVGVLDQLGIPMLQQRLEAMGVTPGMFQNFYTRQAAFGALFTLLKGEFRSARGEFDKWKQSLQGAQEQLSATTKNTAATIGEVLAPVLRQIVVWTNRVVQAVGTFAKDNPGLVRFVLILSSILAILPVLSAATKLWGLTMEAAGTGVMATMGEVILPVLLILGALYIAYKKNFGGMADFIDKWWARFKLVFDGVFQIISTMSGHTSTMSVKTYEALKNSGLLDFVLNIGYVFYTLKEAAKSLWEGFKEGLQPVGVALNVLLQILDAVMTRIFHTGQLTYGLSGIMKVAKAVGIGLAVAVGVLAVAFAVPFLTAIVLIGGALIALLVILKAIDIAFNLIVDSVRLLVAGFTLLTTHDWSKAKEAFHNTLPGLHSDMFGDVNAQIQRVGDFFGRQGISGNVANGRLPMRMHPDDIAAIGKSTADALHASPLQVDANVNLDGQKILANNLFNQSMAEQLRTGSGGAFPSGN